VSPTLVVLASLGASVAFDADRELVLRAGEAEVVAYVVGASGRLHVWSESGELDPRLEVRSGDAALGADDDAGGGTSAWVALEVAAGTRLEIEVSAETPEGSGAVTLHVRELPENEATLALAAGMRRAVGDAVELRAKDEHEAARRRLREALALAQSTPGAARSAPVIEAALDVLQDSYHLSDEATTLAAARWRDAAMEPLYPPDGDQRLKARMQLAELEAEQGHFDLALSISAAALARCERIRPPDDVERVLVAIGHAQVLASARRLEEAEALLREAVARLKRTGIDNPRRFGAAVYVHGQVLHQLGRYEEARELQEQALSAFQRTFGEDDPWLLGAWINHAATLSALGDHQEALSIYERVLAVQERTLPPDHPELLEVRYNVAVQYRSLGDLGRSRRELERLLEGREPTFTHDELSHRQCHALVLTELGEHRAALDALAPVLAEPRWRLEHDHDARWRVHVVLAAAHQGLGDDRAALAAARVALEVLEAHHPPDSVDTTEATARLARLLLRTGDRAGAWELAEKAARRTRDYFLRRVARLSTRQAESLQFNWARLVAAGLELLPVCAGEEHRGRADELPLELVESSRAVGGIALRIAREVRDPALRGELERLRARIAECARRIAVAGGGEDDAELVELLRAKEASEREMRGLLDGAARSSSRLLEVDARAVAAALRPDEAALGFWAHGEPGLGPSAAADMLLLAFVCRRDAPPRRVDLGPLAPIRAACERWRDALVAGDAARIQEAGESLRRQVVDPLLAAAGGATTWRVALDDELHMVPLDALPRGDGVLGDSLRIVVAPSLLELALPRAEASGPPALVAVGGVDYDHEPESEQQPVLVAEASTAALRGGARGEFAELWETAGEVAAIERVFRARFQDAPVVLLEDRDATKGALFAAAPRATHLHVATHGFFAPDSVPSVADARAPSYDALASPESAVSLAGFSPMTLCGLALSGANVPPDDPAHDEGVATAEELASLDLSRCELVVLSACDTNVGYLRANQGLASFQKALHAAGARSVVTSLWKVPDAAAREVMTAFYRALWGEGLAPADALWKAKQALRERRAPARDWAGWVLSGAGR
jgi:CHAT domain-containing protein